MSNEYIAENKDCVIDPKFWEERLAKNGGSLSIWVGDITGPDRDHKAIVDKYIKSGDSVIDVGCGYGRHSMWFNRYLGIDFSPAMIAKAKRLYPEREFMVANFFDLPTFPNKSDWAVSIGCKYMVERYGGKNAWPKLIEQMHKVANQALVLEMSEPNNYFLL